MWEGDGALAELKVATKLVEDGYDVFVPVSAPPCFDLVAHRDGELLRVEVKTTSVQASSGKWAVQIKRVRYKNRIVPFDPASCDVLAVYIEPEDRVVLVQTSEIKARNELRVG